MIEVWGLADVENSIMGLGATIHAFNGRLRDWSNINSDNILCLWEGYCNINPKDFDEGFNGKMNDPMASLAAAAFGLRALLDLLHCFQNFAPKSPDDDVKGDTIWEGQIPVIGGILFNADTTTVRSSLEGKLDTSKKVYLKELSKLVREYMGALTGNEDTCPKDAKHINSAYLPAVNDFTFIPVSARENTAKRLWKIGRDAFKKKDHLKPELNLQYPQDCTMGSQTLISEIQRSMEICEPEPSKSK